MSVLVLTARDPLDAGDGAHPVRTATDLARAGGPVTLVLLEEAVTLARLGHRDLEHLVAALDAGVEVLAEADALRRRAVAPIDGVTPTTFAAVARRLGTGRSVWL